MYVIKSGSSGNTAKVNAKHQLLTKATIKFDITQAAEDGRAYALTSGFIPLTTTSSFSGIFYLKNTGASVFEFYKIKLSSQVACEWKYIKNPTTGTLISSGTAITPVNMRFNSGATISSTFLKGSDSLTITDGTEFAHFYTAPGLNILEPEGFIQMPSLSSFALVCKPSAAGDTAATFILEEEETEEEG